MGMRRGWLALILTLAGCSNAGPSEPSWATLAARADEAGLWTASVTALLVVPGNLTPRITPEQTAIDAAGAAWDPFSPNDCVFAQADGPTVTYRLDDCSGSFGLVHATGHLAVTYQEAGSTHTQFHASSTDLVLNGGPVTFEADASVVYDSDMGVRTIDLSVDTHGVGPEGTMFSRHGTQTARWTDTWGCLFVDTSHDALTMVDGIDWQMQANQLSLCVGECPLAGGSITLSGTEGVLTLEYAGANMVAWSVADQPSESGSMAISCQD